MLDRLVADMTLSTADRLAAVDAQVALARLDVPKGALPDALLKTTREQVARADRETTDAYARQSVISAAADLLTDAGLLDESDTLLKAELTRSHSPCTSARPCCNAKSAASAALACNEKAYAAADGPATRLQWGVSYINALVELSPEDAARIEKAAGNVIGELDATTDTFYGRNQRALDRMSKKLAAWDKDQQHDASLKRMRALTGVCGCPRAAAGLATTCCGRRQRRGVEVTCGQCRQIACPAVGRRLCAHRTLEGDRQWAASRFCAPSSTTRSAASSSGGRIAAHLGRRSTVVGRAHRVRLNG